MKTIRHLTLSQSGMAFDPGTGESFQLNASARKILELLQQGLDVEETARQIVDEFGIAFEQALTDVFEFQNQMQLVGVAA